jgi:hypothetical protein
MANNGLHVTEQDVWGEILRHPSDIDFFYVDTFRAQQAGPDEKVFVQSAGACTAYRIQINLNTWALARSSMLSTANLDKLLNEQKEHYFEGILHPSATNPVKKGFATFIRTRAQADRHFRYDQPILLCADLAAKPGALWDATDVEGRFTLRGRYYVTDDSGDCSFTVKTLFQTNGDQRDATLTLGPGGKLSGDVKSPIPGSSPPASAAKYNTVEVSDHVGQLLTTPAGKTKSDIWTDFRLQTTVTAPPFEDKWYLLFEVDAEATAKGRGNTTLVLLGSMEIVLEPQHANG